MIYITKFRTNDLHPSKGKQIEFNKRVSETFFEFSESSYSVKFECHSLLDASLTKQIKVNLSLSPSRGDYKIYQNEDGSLDLKDYFIETLALSSDTNIDDYYAIRKKSETNYILYYIPKDSLFTNFFSIISGDQILFEEDGDDEVPLTPHPLQQIYYGAPGTGKSHTINELTEGESVIRTTFHPDSDYSTFVGAYKPTMGLLPICDELGQPMKIGSTMLHKEQIVYEFVEQAFLQAYVKAWKNFVFHEGKKQYLVIEEINRGNCAQIFGDLFQLLDRNDYGFSDYPINADKDMQKFLKKAFARTDEPDKQIFLQDEDKERINQMYKGDEDVAYKVFSGEILLLPNNLYIWATMNTSDQSLFPIDSAFKRRWEWQYMPIGQGYEANGRQIKWAIEGATKKYDWWSFLQKINAEVGEATQSEDKKLGFFFCKATDGVISAEKFVGKVIFYLWNDVFKNNGFEGPIFKDVDGTELSFGKFYKSDMKGKAIVQKDKVELFLNNLGVEIVEEDFDDDIDDIEEGEEDATRVSDTNSPYRVTFPDGEVICEDNGWETYIASLQKIGLEKALPFGEMYSRMNKTLPLITKKKIADQGVYKYYEVDNYYVLSGTDSQHRLLKRMNKDLDLGLTIE